MSKYGNKQVQVGGKVFDSRKEACRYTDLRLMEKAGIITDLKTQVPFVLIPAQRDENGKMIERPVIYYADFTYWKDGKYIVEDTKGYRTDVYKIKRKLMLQVHGIRVLET